MYVKPTPSKEDLDKLFIEKPPGILRWRHGVLSPHIKRYDAGIAGSWSSTKDYWRIKIEGSSFQRSRLIWKIHHGIDPVGVLDHINRIRDDDRIENLRDVTDGQNSRNRVDNYLEGYIKVRPGRFGNFAGLGFEMWLWPGEDVQGIRRELHMAVSPIVDKIYSARNGRKNPDKKPVRKPREKLTAAEVDTLLSELTMK